MAESVSVLRVQPHMIPALRAEFASAVDQITTALTTLRDRGYLPEPWLGDESSAEVAAYYTRRALDDPDSSYAALVAYRNQLAAALASLQQMEDHYRRTEGDNADLWGRRV